jgi:transcription antitermination factor NusG
MGSLQTALEAVLNIGQLAFFALSSLVVTQKGGALSLSMLPMALEESRSHAVGAWPENPSWFAVQTRPRHEKKVNLGLKEKGIHSFLPLCRERRRWSDRQQWIELPLFSHYVFVQIPLTVESRVSVLRTSGVLRLAGAPGCGTPVPDEQIENLQAIIDQRVTLAPHEFIKVGERVRIRGGALNGIEGILTAIKNDRSLVVSVDLIQKSVAIRIDGFEVERV